MTAFRTSVQRVHSHSTQARSCTSLRRSELWPLPSRIASIAMTTGEVDRVYHVAFEETERAVHQWGTTHQATHWDEMVSQGRVRDYNELATTLSLT